MKPFEDTTLIALVLACCEDPTHPIEPLSDWIREQNYPEYAEGLSFSRGWSDVDKGVCWYDILERQEYKTGSMPRCWYEIVDQLRALGTWKEINCHASD